MKPAGQPEQAGYGEKHKSRLLRMFVRKFLCNVNDTRALVSLSPSDVKLRPDLRPLA